MKESRLAKEKAPGFAALGQKANTLNRQKQLNVTELLRANPSAASVAAICEKNAARPIANLIKAGVPRNRLLAEITDAVVILLHDKAMQAPFSRLWGVSNRRALTGIVADLRLRANQIERLGKSVVGSLMPETFLWLDRSKGRQDWKTLQRTGTRVPEILRAYASCVEACYLKFRDRSRVKAFRPEEIFERRLVELVADFTDSPHWGEVSSLLYWLYEATGVHRGTNQDAVRKRNSGPRSKRVTVARGRRDRTH